LYNLELKKKTFTKNDLKEIFNTHYEPLVQYANRFLFSKNECEDLVQDVFVGLWEKENIFPNELSLKAYLYKTTRNKCYNAIKHNKIKDKFATIIIKALEDDNLFRLSSK